MRVPKKKFTFEQARFMVEVVISSFVDHISSTVPNKWLTGEAEDEKRFKKERKEFDKNWNFKQLMSSSMQQLSWNLSIMVAQLDGEGMGNGDALQYADLENKLTDWAIDFYEGVRGIKPDKSQVGVKAGRSDLPDSGKLANKWVKQVAKDYPEFIKQGVKT